MDLLFFLFFLPGILVFIYFIFFCIKGRHLVYNVFVVIAELGSLIILPVFYAGFGKQNVCCADEFDTPAFSPGHQLTIAVIIILCLASYTFSKFRNVLLPPVPEILVNVLLVIGIVLNIFISFHVKAVLLFFFGTLPIILLFLIALIKNQRLYIEQEEESINLRSNKLDIFAWKILSLKPLIKYPVLMIASLPLIVLIVAILLLFGQKPDSIVRAFTDTYKHGLSQWDYKCDNVECGGHYLCSVAANGHPNIVKPERLGRRKGHYIVCNRQLLVSNAFEELIQEKLPILHKFIRKQYNKVGNFIHCYYGVFNNKYVSDIIYILMKPLELFFILTLYTFDRKPEKRIAKQYMI